jgi:hypothetical protein
LNGTYSKLFRDWYANIARSNALGDITDFHRPTILESLRLISDCAGDHFSKSRNTEDVAIVRSIVAYSIIFSRLSGIFERQWVVYDSREDLEECRMMEDEWT